MRAGRAGRAEQAEGSLNSADRVGPWDHGAMGPRGLDGAMRRAVRAGRAEQAEGAGMHWGPLNSAARGVWGHGTMQPWGHEPLRP